jgi:hypothetical protein
MTTLSTLTLGSRRARPGGRAWAAFAVCVLLAVFLAAGARAQSGRWAPCEPGAPTPSWATRDAQGCLVVDAGPGWGPLTFMVHSYGLQGVGSNQDQPGNGVDREGCPGSWGPGCPPCNVALWNNAFDNYAPAATGGGHDRDMFQFNPSSVTRHILIRDTTIQNSWNCGGKCWAGSNGHFCRRGAIDENHSDLIQGWGGSPMNDGGWLVVQNSVLRNADVELGQLTEANLVRGVNSQCADSGPGGVLLQGVTFDQQDAFAAECRARGHTWTCERGNYFAIFGNGGTGVQWGPIWLVNVQNTKGATLRLVGDPTRSVIVIGGSGGGNGWPGPLTGVGGSIAPRPCSNGVYATGNEYDMELQDSPRMKIYCYTSIEAALTDTFDAVTCPDCPHQRPPFLGLSAAGWQNPPPGSQ